MIKLGSALLTCDNSSSSAERDFSIMNGLTADPRRCNTSQLRLNTRLSIKCCVHNLRHSCKQCKDLKKKNKERANQGEKNKSSSHCHCPQWSPSEQLVADVSHGKPHQNFKAEEEEKQSKAWAQTITFTAARGKDVEVEKKDIQIEVQRLKKKTIDMKKVNEQEKNLPSSNQRKQVDPADERRRKRKEKEENVAAKRKKLSFIL